MELLVVQTWVKPRKSPAKQKFSEIEKKRRDAMRRLRDAIKIDPVRKRWRDYSKRYYNSMKNKKKIVEQLEIITPPNSLHPLNENMDYCLENNNNLENPSTLRENTPNSSRQSRERKKQRRRNTYKYKLKIKQLEEKLRNEKRQKCPECLNKKIEITDEKFDRSEQVEYCKWVSKRVTVSVKRQEKLSQKTVRETIQISKDPLMEEVKTLMPTIRHVSFLSDGPSTQYRKKIMFFLMVEYIAKTLSVQLFRWHFSERGHGKAAPDGVGECLRRTADTLVGQAKDIHNFKTLVNELNKNLIKIHAIDSTKISEIDKI
ncbi:hypothetical protein ILUMI_17231 [Ignelater luminosus]|uniref:Uncharacterized protein n=1 Tax=Ignelater luminosus TaxID=2038154 RepID=A0A8K0G584_IGNLU|nr:hypothetical protein ILUMI_17231 [Ignelater luminosus]